jgi:hypothetical protein
LFQTEAISCGFKKLISASLVRTLAKPQNKQSSAFFEFSKAPLLRKEGLGWFKKIINCESPNL